MSDIISRLAAASLGLISLCLPLLLARTDSRTRWPLVIVCGACALIMLPPALGPDFGRLSLDVLPLSLWAHLALAPALWLYVEALTSETPFALQKRHLRHALIPAAGLIVPGLVLMLPEATREAMMIRGEAVDDVMALSIAVIAFALILIWIGQSVVYIWRIEKRLVAYRRRLRDLYANNDGRELWWVSILTVWLGGLWLALLATTISGAINGTSLFSADLLYFPAFLGLWALAVYGLSQPPGFEGRYPDANIDPPAELAPVTAKYSRSALTDTQAQRITARLNRAMQERELYLDPTLSLPALSKQVGVPANHISQTLNGHLNETFFEYVNRWRAEAARPLLMETDKTVLEIALEVGFNSKSAFYAAFRRVTGTTPTACRNAR